MSADEKFFAWLDGELGPSEAAQIEARVASDSALARLAERHRAFAARLKLSFDSVAEIPPPEELLATIRNERTQVIDLGAARLATMSGWWPMVPQWAAMAATLAIGVFFGTMMGTDRGRAPLAFEGDTLYAVGALDHALDTRLAAVPVTDDIRIGVTFRDQSGAICRSFTQTGASGLACRSGNGWQLRGLFGAPVAQDGSYRMASGTDPELAAMIDSTITGEPFDEELEKAARSRGWR